MTSRFGVAQVASDSGTGTADATNSGKMSGDTPKGAFIVHSRPTSTNSITAGILASFGVFAGTQAHDALGFGADDAVTGVNWMKEWDNADRQFAGRRTTDYAQRFQGTTSEITNGLRHNTTINTDSIAPLITAAMFAGADVSTLDGEHKPTSSTAQNSTIVNSSESFEADMLIVIMSGNPGATGDYSQSIGFCVNDGGALKQRCFSWNAEGNSADLPTDIISRIHASDTPGASAGSRRVAGFYEGAVYRYGLEVTAIGSSGYTLTIRDGATSSTGDGNIQVFGVKSTDWIFALLDFETPTSGTEVVNAGIDLSSDGGVIRVFTHMEAVDTDKTDNTNFAWGVEMYDGTTQSISAWSVEDNADPTVCKSRTGTAIGLLDGGGALNVEGTTAFGSSGWTDSYTNFPAAVLKNFGLAFGPAASGGDLLLRRRR